MFRVHSQPARLLLHRRTVVAGGGVAHEDIEAPELGFDGVKQMLDARQLTHVGAHNQRLPSELPDRSCDLFRWLAIAEVVDNDGCTFLGELHGNGAADASARTCHQCDLILKSHPCLPIELGRILPPGLPRWSRTARERSGRGR